MRDTTECGSTACTPASVPCDVAALLAEYQTFLGGKAEGTVRLYLGIMQHFARWLIARSGHDGPFHPEQITTMVVRTYLAELQSRGIGVSRRAQVKLAIRSFARWLIAEKGVLCQDPTQDVAVSPQPRLAPSQLMPEQRDVLLRLILRAADPRSAALFALGYWAGCRASELAWLRMEHTHIGPTGGWLHIAVSGRPARDIDLLVHAWQPLAGYLATGRPATASPYVFIGPDGQRLSEFRVQQWFSQLKAHAPAAEQALIHAVRFQDLRHDFAHRAQAAGWAMEEIAYYLGPSMKRGEAPMQTMAGYRQVTRESLKQKLACLAG